MNAPETTEEATQQAAAPESPAAPADTPENVTPITGLRKAPKPTRKQLENEITQSIAGLQAQGNMTKMMLQLMTQQIQRLNEDNTALRQGQTETNYMLRALQDPGDGVGIPEDVLNKRIEAFKIEDFDKQSDEEDKQLGLIGADVVTDDSYVILTTSTPDEEKDQGFLRTRFRMGESAQPQVENELKGKKVGDTFTADVGGVNHLFTVLGIRVADPEVLKKQQEEAVAAAETAKEAEGANEQNG